MEFSLEHKAVKMYFPQDICDHIAHFLREDPRSLRSLRSVSKVWKDAASSQVSIALGNSWVDDAEFLKMVTAFPKLIGLLPIGKTITADGLAEACSALVRTMYAVDLRMCPQATPRFLELLSGFPNIW